MKNLTKIISNTTFATALFLCFGAVAADFNVVNVAMTAYAVNGVNNPTLTLQRGLTYTFAVNSVGHPFDIKTNSTTGSGDRYLPGVTGQGVTSGTLTFTVPANAPNSLFYHCEVHAAMVGSINIINPLPVTLTNTTKFTNGQFAFTVFTTANRTNIVLATTNLGAAGWIPLQTNQPAGSSFNFTDSAAMQYSNRFYRVQEQ
ncbi:MAG TPA: hypothetical protein VK742_05780 [Candidatus Sulfotelmatobacter sp.]|jgi:hypothetical protein|nr:hypothetical protein [Candidatus Sulfotelmatobacter sp.]